MYELHTKMKNPQICKNSAFYSTLDKKIGRKSLQIPRKSLIYTQVPDNELSLSRAILHNEQSKLALRTQNSHYEPITKLA